MYSTTAGVYADVNAIVTVASDTSDGHVSNKLHFSSLSILPVTSPDHLRGK